MIYSYIITLHISLQKEGHLHSRGTLGQHFFFNYQPFMSFACLSQVWLLQTLSGEHRCALAGGPHLCAAACVSLSVLKRTCLGHTGIQVSLQRGSTAGVFSSLLLVGGHLRRCLSPSHLTPNPRPQTTPGHSLWFPVTPWPSSFLLFLIGSHFEPTAPLLFLPLSISSDLLKLTNL